MTTWNHRIVQKVCPTDGPYLEVHEAHYNANGNLCAITENGIKPYGETIEELEQTLQRMLDACKKPILIDGEIGFADWDEQEVEEA